MYLLLILENIHSYGKYVANVDKGKCSQPYCIQVTKTFMSHYNGPLMLVV